MLPGDQQQPPTLTNQPGLPGITGTPQGSAILRIEEQRAPTPQDLGLLIESARSTDGLIQDAALRALGRLERRDVVTDLLPYLRTARADARKEAATAIGQAMRGDVLPLDPRDTQVDGVQQALLSAAASEKNAEAAGEMARTLARLPYRRAAQVVKADRFLRHILELSSGVDRGVAAATRPAACAAVELMARLHGKLAPVDEDTLSALRTIAMARSSTVKLTDVSLRIQAMQALVTAGGVDAEALRGTIQDALSPDLRRLAMAALGSAGSPVTGGDRIDHLRKGLEDREPAVRYEALRGYVRHHAKTDGCQPVMDMLLDTSEHVVLFALDSLGNCAGDENVVNRLIGEARTPPGLGSWRRESHALVSLAKRSPSHLEIPLSSHARHPVWQVRMYAARAAAAASVLPTLELLAADPHDNVRDATLGALRRLKADQAEPHFVAALDRSDYQLLRTAAREMAGLQITPALTAGLAGALTRVTAERKDTSRDTRVAILERLREFGSDRYREQLLPLLRDYDATVATETAKTLNAWTGESFAIDPQPLPPQELPSAAELAIMTEKVAFLEMESGPEIGIRLDPVHAPLMSTRFLRLVNRNYYDGLTFHRVVSNFIVQGGSPGANEYAGDGPYVKDEISERSHARGTVGLSTRGRDTGDAQFFINLVNNPRLDFEYTVFGQVLPRHLSRLDLIQEGDRIVNITFRAAIGPQ
ncbi:MAG TPA: peptidylprolyl isomerase [Vicinamibacterales bacterium]|nr:peptidylprolyl isomerase [Vicinamibacterales bacterium]